MKCKNEYVSKGKLIINELHILNHKKQLNPSYSSVNIKFIGHNTNSTLYLNSHTSKLHNTISKLKIKSLPGGIKLGIPFSPYAK